MQRIVGSSTSCYTFVSSEMPQCAPDHANSPDIACSTLGSIAGIKNALELSVQGTARGAFFFKNDSARPYHLYFLLQQTGTTYDSYNSGKINMDPDEKVTYVEINGDREQNVNPINWGSTGSPFVFKKNGAVAPTHPAFNGNGMDEEWDMMLSNNREFAGSMVHSNLWKLFSILKWGDRLIGRQWGAMLPRDLGGGTSCPNGANPIVACPPSETNTFEMYLSAEKGVSIDYRIRVPYNFEFTLGTIPPDPDNYSSPKLSHTVTSASCTTPDGNVQVDGGLIILEPTLEQENQEIVPQFLNKGLGALQLKLSGQEAKYLPDGEGITSTSTWENTGSAGSISDPDDMLDPVGDWDEEGFYIYQPTAASGFRSLESFNCVKKISSSWLNRWVLVKFDLEVYNVVVNVQTSDKETPTHVATIKDMTVAWMQSSTTAAASQTEQSAG
jgi:hypothetical protein